MSTDVDLSDGSAGRSMAMDAYLPPPARRIKLSGASGSFGSRLGGNPSLFLSLACSRATLTTLAATLVAAAGYQNNPGPPRPSFRKLLYSNTRGEESDGYGKIPNAPSPTLAEGFRNETLKPSLYHILLPQLHSCVVIAQLSTGVDMFDLRRGLDQSATVGRVGRQFNCR